MVQSVTKKLPYLNRSSQSFISWSPAQILEIPTYSECSVPKTFTCNIYIVHTSHLQFLLALYKRVSHFTNFQSSKWDCAKRSIVEDFSATYEAPWHLVKEYTYNVVHMHVCIFLYSTHIQVCSFCKILLLEMTSCPVTKSCIWLQKNF